MGAAEELLGCRVPELYSQLEVPCEEIGQHKMMRSETAWAAAPHGWRVTREQLKEGSATLLSHLNHRIFILPNGTNKGSLLKEYHLPVISFLIWK